MKYATFLSCMEPWAKNYSIPTQSYILFLNITDNLDAVNEGVEEIEKISDTIVKIKYNQRYYKYSTGHSINTFANKIKPVNKKKFIDFLLQYAFDVKSELFKNFKKKKRQIKTKGLFTDPERCFIDITETFSEIIDDAEKAYKLSPRNLSWKERKTNVTNTTNSESVNTKTSKSVSGSDNSVQINSVSVKKVEPLTKIIEENIVTKPENEINSYIKELKGAIKSLIEYGYDTYDGQVRCFDSDLTRDMGKELDKEFEHFKNMLKQISNYNVVNHDERLDDILSTINMVNKKDFVARRGSFRICSLSNKNIHKLLNLISAFLGEDNKEE